MIQLGPASERGGGGGGEEIMPEEGVQDAGEAEESHAQSPYVAFGSVPSYYSTY